MIERRAYREIRPADFTSRAGDKGGERILGASIRAGPRERSGSLDRRTASKRKRERKTRDFREYLTGVGVTLLNFKARSLQKYTRTH